MSEDREEIINQLDFIDAIVGGINLKVMLETTQALIVRLQARHEELSKADNIEYDVAEYCYHLASILTESIKIFANQEFSANYIEEHANTLTRYARIINKEKSSFP